MVAYAIWTKTSGTTLNAALYVGTASSETGTTSAATWQLKVTVFKMPSTGTVRFQVRKLGAAGVVYFAAPMICEYGSDFSTLISSFNSPKEFYGSAAPTTGTWALGDVVYNSAPASAGYIGWVCTVAGAPGTWNTFGLIS
jgi:hypothetical protein